MADPDFPGHEVRKNTIGKKHRGKDCIADQRITDTGFMNRWNQKNKNQKIAVRKRSGGRWKTAHQGVLCDLRDCGDFICTVGTFVEDYD